MGDKHEDSSTSTASLVFGNSFSNFFGPKEKTKNKLKSLLHERNFVAMSNKPNKAYLYLLS